jgi:hypothetical protein
MLKVNRLLMIFLLLATCALIVSCAGGPSFVNVEEIPEQKGLIYLYRKSSLFGVAIVPQIWCNGAPIVSLKSGGYYAYFADPGKTFITAKTESRTGVTIEVEPGKTYYVRLRIGMGIVAGRPHLTLVDEEKGAKEIKGCKLQG